MKAIFKQLEPTNCDNRSYPERLNELLQWINAKGWFRIFIVAFWLAISMSTVFPFSRKS
jgi:hypothetical protein